MSIKRLLDQVFFEVPDAVFDLTTGTVGIKKNGNLGSRPDSQRFRLVWSGAVKGYICTKAGCGRWYQLHRQGSRHGNSVKDQYSVWRG